MPIPNINGGSNTGLGNHLKLIDCVIPALKDAGHEAHTVSQTHSYACVLLAMGAHVL